ncbi:unnamed protein product [Polarella glacialis]|uniref:Uncharacterized protein n=1 Tax=Polarella glacialis TaxID=89957 RepID=A0A813FE33_POLGL|nr:unnamed protein product [Polarella glacialis]CAE8709482.1 unnamed protein product [Polarella glacialis]
MASKGASIRKEVRQWTSGCGHQAPPASGSRDLDPAGLRQTNPEEAETPVSVAGAISQAFTVQGPQQALAMMLGLKQIENRAWRIPSGWYALHVGGQRGSEWGLRAAEFHPALPSEDGLGDFFSSVVGLLHLSDQRSAEQCNGHTWAYGPVCHVVSAAVRLPVPIRQRGNPGLWSLSAELRSRIAEQLQHPSCRLVCHDLSPLGPPESRPELAIESNNDSNNNNHSNSSNNHNTGPGRGQSDAKGLTSCYPSSSTYAGFSAYSELHP